MRPWPRLRIHPVTVVWLAVELAVAPLWQLAVVILSLAAHELAHVAAATLQGLRVEEVELYPVGGQAVVADLTLSDPYVQAAVGLAGPMQSFLLVAAGEAVARLGLLDPLRVAFFVHVNLLLACVNLLPVPPLDGCHPLRAVLIQRVGWREAVARLASWGRAMAGAALVAGGVLGAMDVWVPGLLGIAAVLWAAAGREERRAMVDVLRVLLRQEETLRQAGVVVGRSLVTLTVTRLGEVVRRYAPHRYHRVLVLDAGSLDVVGELTETEVTRALLSRGPLVAMGDLLPPS